MPIMSLQSITYGHTYIAFQDFELSTPFRLQVWDVGLPIGENFTLLYEYQTELPPDAGPHTVCWLCNVVNAIKRSKTNTMKVFSEIGYNKV